MDLLETWFSKLKPYDPFSGGEDLGPLPETQAEAAAASDSVGITVAASPTTVEQSEWLRRFDDTLSKYPVTLVDTTISLRLMRTVGMTREMEEVRPPAVSQALLDFRHMAYQEGKYFLDFPAFHNGTFHLVSLIVKEAEFFVGQHVRALRLSLHRKSVQAAGNLEHFATSADCLLRDAGATQIEAKMYQMHNASVALCVFRPSPVDYLVGEETASGLELWPRTPTAAMAIVKYCFDVDPTQARSMLRVLLKHDTAHYAIKSEDAHAIREHVRITCEPLDPQDLVVCIESFDGAPLPGVSENPDIRGVISVNIAYTPTGP